MWTQMPKNIYLSCENVGLAKLVHVRLSSPLEVKGPNLVSWKTFESNQQQSYKGHAFIMDRWEVCMYATIRARHQRPTFEQSPMSRS